MNREANSRTSPETTPSPPHLDQAAPELHGSFYSNQYIYFLYKQEICAFRLQWFRPYWQGGMDSLKKIQLRAL